MYEFYKIYSDFCHTYSGLAGSLCKNLLLFYVFIVFAGIT